MNPKTFDDFKILAQDKTLNLNEKVDFPLNYRGNGLENRILRDLTNKAPNLKEPAQLVIDIGCGCAFVETLLNHCLPLNDSVVLVDSQEMLDLVPNRDRVIKYPFRFPNKTFLNLYQDRADVIIVYSVLQYVFNEGNLFGFLDAAVKLLAPGGQLVLGDIPNHSKAKRNYKEAFKGGQIHNEIDDSILLTILSRYRSFGFETYLLPQNPELAFANRREDIIIQRV